MSSAARQMALVALLLAAVLGLYLAAELGQRKLEEVRHQVEVGAQRERSLAQVLQLLSQAESSQRGSILLDDRGYLDPYYDSVRRLPQALRQLDLAFVNAGEPLRTEVAEVEHLSNAKAVEMSETLNLYRDHGRAAAVDLIRTDIGKWTMTQLSERVRKIQGEETDNILAASRSWRIDRWINLAITTTALAASVFLVLLLRRLVVSYMRSKERETEDLAERGTELERQVQRRTQELSELSTHLQSLAERERAALSRELHDELGGLLVAARMDVSWLEDRLADNDPEVHAHFKRIHEALQAGVDVKRRVVENLRPTLLDNLGLVPALRWQVADTCGRAGIECTEHYPPHELSLTPDASIAIFRIVQEALTNIIKHAEATHVDVSLEVLPKTLLIRVRDDGIGVPPERLQALRAHGLAAMRHRAVALGGQWRMVPGRRGTEIEVRLPLDKIEAAPLEEEPYWTAARSLANPRSSDGSRK
ncbi:MAG TPA: CHASE3 domain-containing protein [Candidatus Dormibacteraeota bacterium]|nr:CHASE3 domain-containing protein [Candidatus Dormibacteraeota bacterium]HYL69714.1 CHASE3 domain-containing protein [Candidatus Dormibacteraeota bacterium]